MRLSGNPRPGADPNASVASVGQRGFTLVELLVVATVLAAVGTLVVVSMQDGVEAAHEDTTHASLTACRDAIVGAEAGAAPPPCYLADMVALPTRVADLLRMPVGAVPYDPALRIGWRGPYLHAPNVPYVPDPPNGFDLSYGAPGDPVILDGWNRPIVLQVPDADGDGTSTREDRLHARLISAGSDGILQTPRTDAAAGMGENARFPSRARCGDDLLLYLNVADLRL